MYAVLSKNSEASFDVLYTFTEHQEPKIQALIDNAFTKHTELVGMETTSFRDTARLGSTWDGVSFSGGISRPEGSVVLDIWDDNKRFSFLSDNIIVTNIVLGNASILSDFVSEKFQGEVVLVQVPEDQSVSLGENHGWDGSRFI
jgi:hypothetical protein